jgi:hypothetical protein
MSPETTEHVRMVLRAEMRALEIETGDLMRMVATATRDQVEEILRRVVEITDRIKWLHRRLGELS